MRNWPEINPAYCPYRITRETVQLDTESLRWDRRQIPANGICDVSPSRQTPCYFSGSQTASCETRQNNDFCDCSWAADPEDFAA